LYKKSGLDEAALEEIAARAQAHMVQKTPYRDESLTIGQLAEAIDVPVNHLSQAINSRLGQNFYTFVNRHRFEEVKRRLSDPDEKESSILVMAYDAGFKSKSTFNAFFKKQTGQTPSAYREAAGQR